MGELWLETTRTLPAPRERVFALLTEPDQLAEWWGPAGFTTPSIELDLRPGGGYRFEMQPPDGDVFFLQGEYTEVEPPRLLAFTFRWEDPDPDDQETTVTLRLEDRGEQTELNFRQGPFKTEARRDLHRNGWGDGWEKIEALLAR
jgi:uncharacterized protein YndB with AHSA1/START domain